MSGLLADDHFDERHLVHRREEMQADELRRPFEAAASPLIGSVEVLLANTAWPG